MRRDDTFRPPISEAMKAKIREAFALVPADRKGAVVVLADEHGTRLHVAHRFNDHWKVGGVVAVPWGEKPEGYVGIEGSW